MIDQAQDERAIFFAALERPAGPERDAYLREACSGESELLNRVRWLFSLHEQSQGPLDSPPPGLCITAAANQPTEQPGTVIGRYKLLEQVGEGGMGVVCVAEQTEPVRRRVALKIIKPGMDTKQVIARFEAERQALAMMDHPNIARVLDAGTTEVGRPYFVMELVRGMPITEYCDKAKLTPRQRLELFIDVCQAVQHAHQKGIIHRDLKPSNVLITLHDGKPVVKVIDFGVAKAISQQLTDRTVYTALTQLVGTPLYMSPEQAEISGLDVDTRSDVYSLGVLLYELLTGQTPFDKDALSKAGFDEMRRIIREDEPLRPSRRFSTLGVQAISTASQHRGLDERRLSKILSGELDWIVMKALEKDRSRRYESASALAADIQRYLSDEPVLACPPTTMYRFQKFARKHRPAIATAASIALCLILGTTVSAWQAVRATTAEAEASANEAQANQAAAAEAQQRQRAEANAQIANTQRDEAQKQRDEIKALNDQLRRTLYASNMNLAKSAWDAGHTGRVNELLDQHRPKAGEADLRGFEWHYLNRLCHSELLALEHGARIGGMAFSPDGKRLASASYDKLLKVWDTQTGKALLTIELEKSLNNVVFSPDGKRLATGAYGYNYQQRENLPSGVKVWDAETGQQLLSIEGARSNVAFSPDGKRLASRSGTWDDTKKAFTGEVKLWNSQTGQELLSINGQGESGAIAFSPDGQRLATVDRNATVRIWDSRSGQELLSVKDAGDWVVFSPDGKRLATVRKVLDSETGKELLTLNSDTFSVAFSSDGKRLATADRTDIVTLLDAETGAQILSFKGTIRGVTSVVFSASGNKLACAGPEGIIKIWDATTSQESRTFGGDTERFTNMSFSPDGKRLAFGTAGTWDAAKDALVDGKMKVLESQTGQELMSLNGHSSSVNSVAFSPDGQRLASASSDQTVKVWDAQAGRELLTIKGHTSAVVCVAFSPDGKRLVSCSSRPSGISTGPSGKDPGEPGEVVVWDASSGQELLTLKGHRRFVNSVAFSPDGKLLATLSRDNTVKVWDAQTGRELLSLPVQSSSAGCVAFSPDGKQLASSSETPPMVAPPNPHASEVKVWDVQTGQELFTLKGPSHSVAFSPDGKRLVCGSGGYGPRSGGALKVWDALTGQELLTLNGRSETSNDVAFSPDGHRLISKGRDRGTVKIWDATPLPEKP
jgi:WD40 repeat protein/serine/threonine protein kinase